SLQAHVGIATGLVVGGDLFDSGEAQERGIVGETPNLAARLQEIAEPNMVVICDSTRRLLGTLFELEDLGPSDLKGLAKPARAWAALRASSVASRFEALHATGLTTLVGRDEECELLLRRWLKAKSGEGQMCVVVHQSGGAFHLAHDRIKRTVRVLRRAEIAQARMRLGGEAFQQRGSEPRFPDTGLAGEQHHPAGIRSALDRTASRDCPRHQSTGAA